MRPPLSPASSDVVDRFVAAAERFAVDVAAADLRAPVPGCPRWTTYDLAVHLGNVHAWAATIVETGRAAPAQNDEPGRRRPHEVSAWYAGKAEDLYEVLRAADPRAPCWNFAYGDGQAAFWPRRQMHETTVHLLDLAAAQGDDLGVDPALAADGIDEVLTVFAPRMHRRSPAALTAPLCLVATDTADAWTVSPQETGPPRAVARRDPAADRVEATAETLYRLLWKRLDDPAADDRITLTGDSARVRAYLSSRLVP